MRRPKRIIERSVAIDGHSLLWNLHREQRYNSVDGWTGLSIHVRVANVVRRELYLEYPCLEPQNEGLFKTDFVQLDVQPAKVEEHIRQAMNGGWDPESRGKPVYFILDELPGSSQPLYPTSKPRRQEAGN